MDRKRLEEVKKRRKRRDDDVSELYSQSAGKSLKKAQVLEEEGSLRLAAVKYEDAARNFGIIGEDREATRYYHKARMLFKKMHVPPPDPSYARSPGAKAKYHREQAAYDRIRRRRSLWGKVGAAFFTLLGILMLSPSITGNSISNTSIVATNILGAVLFLAGIAGLFFIIKRKY